MKLYKQTRKGLLCLLMAFILLSVTVLPAAADAWFPPDDNYNEALMNSPWSNKSCMALSVFVSNFAETNLTSYNKNTSDGTVIAAMMKHFEMNPYIYGDSVTVHKDNAGQQYLAISGSKFESRVKNMFGRSITASSCPGFQNGTIYVNADFAGNPIQVLASPRECYYIGNYQYTVSFAVYQVSSATSQLYATCSSNLSNNPNCKEIGSGWATFFYYGSNSATEFYASDFTLSEFTMDVNVISYGNANGAYVFPKKDSAPIAAVTTEAEAMTTDTAETQVSQTEQDVVMEQTQSPKETSAKGDVEKTGNESNNRLLIILAAALVALIAILAFAAVLILNSSKKKEAQKQELAARNDRGQV